MSHQKHVIACAAMLLGRAMVVGPASAQSLTPPFASYSAKFSCGPQAADKDVVKGVYATSINIHNPQAQTTVNFFKKAVIANPEGSPLGSICVLNSNEALPPDLRNRSTARSFTGSPGYRRPPISRGSS
jgi:hypothetical protein